IHHGSGLPPRSRLASPRIATTSSISAIISRVSTLTRIRPLICPQLWSTTPSKSISRRLSSSRGRVLSYT
ncbi:hypothetical protein EV182_004907, partial [Spiromyces aspiralis]